MRAHVLLNLLNDLNKLGIKNILHMYCGRISLS